MVAFVSNCRSNVTLELLVALVSNYRSNVTLAFWLHLLRNVYDQQCYTCLCKYRHLLATTDQDVTLAFWYAFVSNYRSNVTLGGLHLLATVDQMHTLAFGCICLVSLDQMLHLTFWLHLLARLQIKCLHLPIWLHLLATCRQKLLYLYLWSASSL